MPHSFRADNQAEPWRRLQLQDVNDLDARVPSYGGVGYDVAMTAARVSLDAQDGDARVRCEFNNAVERFAGAVGQYRSHPFPTFLSVSGSKRVAVVGRVAERLLVHVGNSGSIESGFEALAGKTRLPTDRVETDIHNNLDPSAHESVDESSERHALVPDAVDAAAHGWIVDPATGVSTRRSHSCNPCW